MKRQKEALACLVDRTDMEGVKQYFLRKKSCITRKFIGNKGQKPSTSVRRMTNHLSFLKNEQGEQVHDQAIMCHMVKDYFNNLFSNNRHGNEAQSLTADKCVTEAQNQELVANITFEEFTIAIKLIYPD